MNQLDSFREQVEAFLRRTKMPPTRFGVDAVNDPRFIATLRADRAPSLKTVDRVLTFMAEHDVKREGEGGSGMTNAQIRSYFDRWLRLEEEKKALSNDLKDLFAEAKSNGHNAKAMRAAFTIKRKRDDKTEAYDALQGEIDVYLVALGMDGVNSESIEVVRALDRREERQWNVDENGKGPRRRQWEAMHALFDSLEASGEISGKDKGRTVYFLLAEAAGLVKIGSSDNVQARIRGIASMSPIPLKLVGTVSGGVVRELELHKQFKEFREHGEWFSVEGGCLEKLLDIATSEKHASTQARNAHEAAGTRPVPSVRAKAPHQELPEQQHDTLGVTAGETAPIQMPDIPASLDRRSA